MGPGGEKNEISQRTASGVSRRPVKKAGRVPTQNARPEKNGNNVKNRAGRQKQRDAYPPRRHDPKKTRKKPS